MAETSSSDLDRNSDVPNIVEHSAEELLQQEWAPFIVKVARRNAPAGVDPRDLEQVARMRLLRHSRTSPRTEKNYIGAILANEIRHAAGQAAKRSMVPLADVMVAGDSRVPLLAADVEPDDDSAVINPLRRQQTNRNEEEDKMVRRLTGGRIRHWTEELPPRVRETYRHLYVLGRSQSETARAMGVSQPRVAQLHARLKDLGRVGLETLAA